MPDGNRNPNFSLAPMLWLALWFAVGILAARFFDFDIRTLVAACSVFAVGAIVTRTRGVASVFVALAFASIGTLAFVCETERNTEPDRLRMLYDTGVLVSGSPVEVVGVLSGSPEASVDGEFITLTADALRYRGEVSRVSGRVRLFVASGDLAASSEISNLKYGSRVRAVCDLERENDFRNPGVQPKTEVLDRLGVDATCTVKSRRLIEHLADESVFLPLAWVYDARGRLISEFRQNLDPKTAGVMIASLLGDKYFLDKQSSDLFRDGGTFHILVISGLHITFIGGLLLWFLKKLTRRRWLQFVVTTAVLWAYTLAVGADVPVVRAAIMFTVVSFAYVIYRRSSLLNSLGICGLLLLVWRPADLSDPSFLLTFVSVGAIVGVAYPLVEKLKFIGTWTPTARQPFPPRAPSWLRRSCETIYWNLAAWQIEAKRHIWTANIFKSPFCNGRINDVGQSVLRYLFEALLVSFVVQLAMLPLTVVYFHRVSIASVLLNIWVGFFIALESFTAVAGVIAGNFSTLLAAAFYRSAEIFNWIMLAVPRSFSDNGIASFRLPAYSGYGKTFYLLYFVPVLIIAIGVNKWRPFELRRQDLAATQKMLVPAFAVLACLAAIIIFHPLSAPHPDGRLHIDFLDVGQGDSALVTFPNGQTMLVDGGGRVDYRKTDEEGEPFKADTRGIGEAVVSEFLWDRGLSRIDYILATHADADHIQGLEDVAKNFKIGSAVFGRTPEADPDFASLATVLQMRGIPAETLSRGQVFDIAGVNIQILYPIASDDPDAVSDNDHSVVLRLVYGSRAFLLTGDIERSAEAAIVNGGGNLDADVIKVPHHGSKTSSTAEFIVAVRPKYAVISVGRSSPFGHPHKEVVDRWKASGAEILTTGQKGTVTVTTDGRDLTVSTFELPP